MIVAVKWRCDWCKAEEELDRDKLSSALADATADLVMQGVPAGWTSRAPSLYAPIEHLCPTCSEERRKSIEATRAARRESLPCGGCGATLPLSGRSYYVIHLGKHYCGFDCRHYPGKHEEHVPVSGAV